MSTESRSARPEAIHELIRQPFHPRTLAIVPGETLRGSAVLYCDDDGGLRAIDISGSFTTLRLPGVRSAVLVAPRRSDLGGRDIDILRRRSESYGSLCALLRNQLPVYVPTLLECYVLLGCDPAESSDPDQWLRSWLKGCGIDRVTHPDLYCARISEDRSRIPEKMMRIAAAALGAAGWLSDRLRLHPHEPRPLSPPVAAG